MNHPIRTAKMQQIAWEWHDYLKRGSLSGQQPVWESLVLSSCRAKGGQMLIEMVWDEIQDREARPHRARRLPDTATGLCALLEDFMREVDAWSSLRAVGDLT